MAMTVDELDTLSGIASAVRRIETALARQDDRMAKQDERLGSLEKSAARIDGALTFAKIVLGIVGFSGITFIVWAMSHGGA